MPYEDEIPPDGQLMSVPAEFNELTRLVIGAAIEVHRQVGPGLPEEAYQRSMEIELAFRQIPFESQKYVDIKYKGTVVARGKIDLLVAQKLVVEIKSVEAIALRDRLQTRSYMRILRQPLGLLINFNVPVLKEGIRRIIDTEP